MAKDPQDAFEKSTLPDTRHCIISVDGEAPETVGLGEAVDVVGKSSPRGDVIITVPAPPSKQ